jgi:uncharacterized protein YggU (UPF0235/DUF167 family)
LGLSFYERGAEGVAIAVKALPCARRVGVDPLVPAAAAAWPAARAENRGNAPPEHGLANAAIITALAGWLGVKPGAITLIAGGSGREKKFVVDGSVEIPAV